MFGPVNLFGIHLGRGDYIYLQLSSSTSTSRSFFFFPSCLSAFSLSVFTLFAFLSFLSLLHPTFFFHSFSFFSFLITSLYFLFFWVCHSPFTLLLFPSPSFVFTFTFVAALLCSLLPLSSFHSLPVLISFSGMSPFHLLHLLPSPLPRLISSSILFPFVSLSDFSPQHICHHSFPSPPS